MYIHAIMFHMCSCEDKVHALNIMHWVAALITLLPTFLLNEDRLLFSAVETFHSACVSTKRVGEGVQCVVVESGPTFSG